MKMMALAMLLGAALAGGTAAASVYVQKEPVAVVSDLDKLLAEKWLVAGVGAPRAASDSVWVRRVYLDLLGRLPTVEEAQSFVGNTNPAKDRMLVRRLLNEPAFNDYWTLKFADMLRVKSEFPINLWPNAVYVYQRRIHDFWGNHESCAHFAAALLRASGSNFRVPEANYYRALASRTPEGLAAATMQSWFGLDWSALPQKEKDEFVKFFASVRYKPTREWKEEIVYAEPLENAAKLTLPGGEAVEVAAGADSRKALADYVEQDPDGLLARAMANRIWSEFFGRGLLNPVDGMNRDATADECDRAILDYLAQKLKKSGYDLRRIQELIATSALYRAGTSAKPEEVEQLRRNWALFPIRRLPAEVLEDMLRDLTESSFAYSSVIPEPFTYLPENARTVTLADGSISSAFLLLFGRPARDSGLRAERNDDITAKQRLFLFNSGMLYSRINRIPRRADMKGLRPEKMVERIYWLFYSRGPTADEVEIIRKALNKLSPQERWRMAANLVWILLNTEEFLYQH